MLNCPASNNTCPARALKHSPLLDVLHTTSNKAMDGIPVDDDVYRAALVALKSILESGCSQCVRNAVIWLANDMKWPPNRGLQLVFIEDLLQRTAPVVH